MRPPALEFALDPFIPLGEREQVATTFEWPATNTRVRAVSCKSDASSAKIPTDPSMTSTLSHDTGKQPSLSLAFSTPQPRSIIRPQATFGTPSFGGKPSFGSASIWTSKPAHPPLPTSKATSISNVHYTGLMGNGALSMAINRAALNRPAIIGRQELKADRLVTSYLSSATGSPSVKSLAAEVGGIAHSHPTAFNFLQHVFDEVCRNRDGSEHRRELSDQSFGQSYYEARLVESFHSNFDDCKWGEELGNYILRMIIFGLPPREIRAAVEKDMDWTHGRNHVDAKEVESIVTWMRGPAVNMVENARFHGTAMDFFRPSIREEKSFAKVAKGGEYIRSWQAGGSGEGAGDRCRCSDRQEKSRVSDKTTRSSVEKQREFRFMNLPAELRNWVYKAAVVPTGYISLRSCAHHMPAAVHPTIPTAIFEISKAFNKEADSLLFENTIIVNACLESGSRPAIHRSQLPAHILPLIKSLVIVVDFTRMLDILNTARVVDWRAAQGLVGLRQLRICGIATTDPQQRLSDYIAEYLEIILERIPADCNVYFGERDGGQEVEAHVQDMVKKISGGPSALADPQLKHAYAMGGARLEREWMMIEERARQGCKSGFKEDFRFEERRTRGELDQAWLHHRQTEEDLSQDDEDEW